MYFSSHATGALKEMSKLGQEVVGEGVTGKSMEWGAQPRLELVHCELVQGLSVARVPGLMSRKWLGGRLPVQQWVWCCIPPQKKLAIVLWMPSLQHYSVIKIESALNY